LPVDRLLVVREAVPEFSVPVPRIAPPSKNVAVRVGVPENWGLTVTVNVTDCPKVAGFVELVTADVDDALFTVWLIAAELLVLKFASPA
jgi:hypothetical protein